MEPYELRLDPSFVYPLNGSIYNPVDAKTQRREEIGICKVATIMIYDKDFD